MSCDEDKVWPSWLLMLNIIVLLDTEIEWTVSSKLEGLQYTYRSCRCTGLDVYTDNLLTGWYGIILTAIFPGAFNDYKAKTQVDYYFGMDVRKKEEENLAPPAAAAAAAKATSPEMTENHVKPADEDTTWSDSTTSDMLF